MNKLIRFYNSRTWRNFSKLLKTENNYMCYKCNKIELSTKNLIAHHKIELTEDNVDDVDVSLNKNNIDIICFYCHNRIHNRFGYNTKKVYIIYGSPNSGKRILVNQLYQPSDIVLDLDKLYSAIGIKNDYIKFNAFKLRDEMLDQIKTRYGNWRNAYVIGGYPNKIERENLAERIGAELIYTESTEEQCLELAKNERDMEYIKRWWVAYTP
jgi:hypothetical protein